MSKILGFLCRITGGHIYEERGWGFDTVEDISYVIRKCIVCRKEEKVIIGDSSYHNTRYLEMTK